MNFTRRLRLLLILAGACASCATVQPTVTQVQGVVDCSAKAVVSQLPAIITDVTTDLLAKDYVKLLTDLAQRVGDDAVVCAVSLSAQAAENRKASHPGTAQPNADVVTTNAADYLRLRAVRLSTGAPQ